MHLKSRVDVQHRLDEIVPFRQLRQLFEKETYRRPRRQSSHRSAVHFFTSRPKTAADLRIFRVDGKARFGVFFAADQHEKPAFLRFRGQAVWRPSPQSAKRRIRARLARRTRPRDRRITAIRHGVLNNYSTFSTTEGGCWSPFCEAASGSLACGTSREDAGGKVLATPFGGRASAQHLGQHLLGRLGQGAGLDDRRRYPRRDIPSF